MRIVRVLGTPEPGGAQLSALRLSAALRRHGVATTLLAGDATAPGLELAARYGLPADAYRVRGRQLLPSLQWTPSPGFARWLGPRLGRADLVHAHMVGAWWAAALALPPDVPLVASEHRRSTGRGGTNDACGPALSCAVMRPPPFRPFTSEAVALAGPGRDAGRGVVLAAECASSRAGARSLTGISGQVISGRRRSGTALLVRRSASCARSRR